MVFILKSEHRKWSKRPLEEIKLGNSRAGSNYARTLKLTGTEAFDHEKSFEIGFRILGGHGEAPALDPTYGGVPNHYCFVALSTVIVIVDCIFLQWK